MQLPKYPVNVSEESDKYQLVPKLKMSENEESANLYVEENDVKGAFDFSIDVQSMTVNADEERRQARQTAVSLLVSNPNILALLQQEGVKPKFKELFVSWLDDLGFSDAERYFESSGAPGAGGVAGGTQSLQDLLKMFGGGRLNQNEQGQGGQPAVQPNVPFQPGAGANQLARVSQEQPNQQQTTVGQPNPDMYKRLVDKYGSQTTPPTG